MSEMTISMISRYKKVKKGCEWLQCKCKVRFYLAQKLLELVVVIVPHVDKILLCYRKLPCLKFQQ
jgi:hypothetical protein